MTRINQTFLLFGMGFFGFVVAGIADAILRHSLAETGGHLHSGVVVAILLYFYSAAKLSQSKHRTAAVTTLAMAITGYIAIVTYLIKFIFPSL